MQFKKVARPKTLKHGTVAEAHQPILDEGVHVAIGTDPADAGEVRQLDIRYRHNKTFVSPIGGPETLKPWTLDGYVSAFDCRTHFHANKAKLHSNPEKGS